MPLTKADKEFLQTEFAKLATKDDLTHLGTKLRAEMAQLRVDLMDEMARVYKDLHNRVEVLEDKL